MSTPILWILFPLLISGISLFFMRYRKILKWGGMGISLVLALSAVILPVNVTFNLLFWEVKISDQLLVFGRRFILSSADQPVVILLFAILFFWLVILDLNIVPMQFFPFSLAGITLILTAYAVDPIYYGALFFAFLALINVVLLSPPGEEPTPGVLRFLIYQILGMLFILFAAWLASWIDLNSGDQVMLGRSLLILALGFSFLLSVFPFLSWIPMVGEENHPFVTGFVFNTYFLGIFLFGSRFITEGGWLVQGGNLQNPLQFAGAIMVGFGGILAVFSKHLGRLSGAVVIAEIGRSLLALSLFLTGFPIYFAMVIIQSLSLGVWASSLSTLKLGVHDLNYTSLTGAARQWPVITSGLLLGYFTLAGLPLLGGFPIYWALGSSLAFYPLWINISLVLGSVGLIIGGLRILGVFTKDSGEEPVLILGEPFTLYLILGLNFLLLLLGFFPQVLLKITRAMTEILMGF